MLFNSYLFLLLFLPLSFLICFVSARLGGRTPYIWSLFGASLIFYGWWHPPYVLLLLFSIVVNYTLARLLDHGESRNKRVLVIGLTFNLGLLAYFKYAGFFAENILQIFNASADVSSILLPIGISFFTFQQIAYLIDVYRGIKTRYSFSEYGLFVSFFPQLIAGPIVHHREMMPQFLKLNWKDAGLRTAIGLSLIIFGLFKKVILADNIAEYSTPVFEMADGGVPITLLPAWIGALGFSLQIYFDFSGYTDIALGLGTLYGIKLPINFFSPYKADSIIDFWRRWHISLSRFLKDYLYIPLGGNRRRQFVNIGITMLLGGLWHGAAWTFIAWGGLHGIFLIINHTWRKLYRSNADFGFGSWLITASAVIFAWVPFRAETFQGSWDIWRGMLGFNGILLPESYYHWLPETPLAQWFLSLQVGTEQFLRESAYNENLSYVNNFDYAKEFVLLLVVVLGLPNTMQLFSRYSPFLSQRGLLESTHTQSIFLWKPNLAWGAITSIAACMVLYSLNDVSEFLYFNF
jgi:alginate O-acetyltransferase complex protein AlgI